MDEESECDVVHLMFGIQESSSSRTLMVLASTATRGEIHPHRYRQRGGRGFHRVLEFSRSESQPINALFFSLAETM